MAKHSERLRFTEAELTAQTLCSAACREDEQEEDNNAAVDAAGTAARYGETACRASRSRLDREEDSSSHAKRQQKQAMKKEYAKRGRGSTVKAPETAAKSSKRAAKDSKRTGTFFARHKKGFCIAAAFGVMVVLLVNLLASCSVLVQGGLSAVTATTYPSKDEDMLVAEDVYCAMEDELQQRLDNYEAEHDYDEYSFDLDEIGHDPYVLISAVTALTGREWTVGEVGDILTMLFQQQYILTETVTEEIRYRTETETRYVYVFDRYLGRYVLVEREYEVEVPYTYYICEVTLENFDLSHVPVYIMSQEQLARYAAYMGTLGNRPDLFGDSEYVDKYYGREDADYEIPEEALEDEVFAAMIAEAEKYLGMPYVWGGSTPETSFDCSGFVSWVINHCGVGWNVGRLGANGLLNICTRVSPADARPGDLIFFQGTYDTTGASHVGIYVGGGQIIHCGDPIQYTSIESPYWQEHFLAFGRLPTP